MPLENPDGVHPYTHESGVSNRNLATVTGDNLKTQHANRKGTDEGEDGDPVIACQ
jgi:hypothetical protein